MAVTIKRTFLLTTLTLLVVVLLAGLFLLFRDRSGPALVLTPQAGPVSKNTEFVLTATDEKSGIRRVVVQAGRGPTKFVVLQKEYPSEAATITEKFSIAQVMLEDGPLVLEIAATDGSWARFGKGNTSEAAVNLQLDTVAPMVSTITSPPNIRQGGSAFVAFTSAEPAASAGVRVDDLFFPAFKQANGQYYCFFAFPHFLDKGNYRPMLVVADTAGNRTELAVSCHLLPVKFKHDSIQLPDSFLETKMPEFAAETPGNMSHLERFLVVNRDLRDKSTAVLLKLGQETASTMLWSGTFTRMPRAAPTAGFADVRAYIYNGQQVDEQTHMGVDLASVKNTPVPAANSGVVIMAGYLNIYGQLVVLDHGLGLHSLYGHLSEMGVKVGDRVEKDQIIGKTGMTGMAGGDHLHYGMLLSGIPINPVEWWDDHWIKDNLTDRLGGPPAGETAASAPTPAPAN
jgi:hypothetical protein